MMTAPTRCRVGSLQAHILIPAAGHGACMHGVPVLLAELTARTVGAALTPESCGPCHQSLSFMRDAALVPDRYRSLNTATRLCSDEGHWTLLGTGIRDKLVLAGRPSICVCGDEFNTAPAEVNEAGASHISQAVPACMALIILLALVNDVPCPHTGNSPQHSKHSKQVISVQKLIGKLGRMIRCT